MRHANLCMTGLVLILLLVALITPASATLSKAERSQRLNDAMMAGDVPAAKRILSGGPVTITGPGGGFCWLAIALMADLEALIKPMVEAGVPVDCTPQKGDMTPLQRAVYLGDYESARLLVQLGANVNAHEPASELPSNHTPLDMAVSNYVLAKELDNRVGEGLSPHTRALKSVIRFLLAKGANPNIANASGDIPLFLASAQGAIDVVRWLLDAGADPSALNNSDGEQYTPLEAAIWSGNSNPETVEALLYAGADPQTGPHADVLLEKARKKMPAVVPLLKQYGVR